MAYLASISDVKKCPRLTMPGADVDEVHRCEPDFVLPTAEALQGEIDAQIRKRFPNQVQAWRAGTVSVPMVVLGWLGVLLTPELYAKRGINAGEPAEVQVQRWEAAREVRAILQSVADSVESRYDLELGGVDTTATTQAPMPLAYSEQSAHTSKHLQGDTIRGNRRYG